MAKEVAKATEKTKKLEAKAAVSRKALVLCRKLYHKAFVISVHIYYSDLKVIVVLQRPSVNEASEEVCSKT